MSIFDSNLRFFVERRIHQAALALYGARQRHDGRVDVMRSITVETSEPGSVMGEPLMLLASEEAQSLMDELWNAGVRPGDVGSAGQLAAVQKHLEDMRALAFTSLKTPKP